MSDAKIQENKEIENLARGFLNTTFKEILSILGTECGSLFLFDHYNKDLVLDSLRNSDNLNLGGLRKGIGEGIIGKVANTRNPVLVKDIDKDGRFRSNGFNHYQTKSFISIPLFSSKGLMGVINITDKSNREAFSEKDFNFAVAICNYACQAIDKLICCADLKQEKETLHKQKSLLEKYASVGKLAAGIVHEVNNPLDGIIRYTNILLIQLENNSIAREYLLEAKKGLNRIANITKSLLEFSHQVNSNSFKIKKYVDVHKLIDESLDLLQGKFNDSVRVDKKYKTDLPKMLDLGLTHVLANIIKNSLDAMPQGGRLEIATEAEDSVIKISFKDTGLGIPAEIREQIFEPFFTTKEIDKGTGLGLSICNEIISNYKGRIEVESSHGQGSTFTVLIPKEYLEDA